VQVCDSPFTRALLKHIGTKGISIQDLMIRVRKSVMEETRNEQIPWEEAALNEPFSFLQAASTGSSAGGTSRAVTQAESGRRPGNGGTCPGPHLLRSGRLHRRQRC
jgi:uncharacterized caspase-like protein